MNSPWKRPLRFGYRETLRGLGGVVAPLLTGFSLTAIVLLLTASATPPRVDWASVAFVLTVACLLFSMQVAFLALARSPSPADILTWNPEVAMSVAALRKARAEQAGLETSSTSDVTIGGSTLNEGNVYLSFGVAAASSTTSSERKHQPALAREHGGATDTTTSSAKELPFTP